MNAPLIRNEIAWEMSENDTVGDMFKEIFFTDDMAVRTKIKTKDHLDVSTIAYLSDYVFITPYGLCLKLDLKLNPGLKEVRLDFMKVGNYKIMFVYPEMLYKGYVLLNGESNAQLSVNSGDFGSVHMYNVNLFAKINNPIITDCTDDCAKHTNCLDKYTKQNILSLYGCLPPWMEDSVLTCNRTIPLTKTLEKTALQIFDPLISGNIVSNCTKEFI